MSIKFKSVVKTQPGVAGGGERKYYANPVMSGEMNLDSLTRSIEKISTVSGADIRAVLYALVDVSIDALGDSNIVRLGDLGSLRISLSSDGKSVAEEVKAGDIRKAGIVFTPGSRLKDMLANAKYVKADN
ncbi:MAG: DNA-binding protein [Bacteroidales bacterium]|jgi:predicted histone-like DNA-binding protein|nr:DNA-binding protein [Bacteroidales bacterium]